MTGLGVDIVDRVAFLSVDELCLDELGSIVDRDRQDARILEGRQRVRVVGPIGDPALEQRRNGRGSISRNLLIRNQLPSSAVPTANPGSTLISSSRKTPPAW